MPVNAFLDNHTRYSRLTAGETLVMLLAWTMLRCGRPRS
jgi:hypothetical protein